MSYLALAAAALTFLWFLVHLFAGGRDVAAPLRRAESLSAEVSGTAWLCWHYVTVTLLIMAGLFAAGAIRAEPMLILAAVILSAAFAITGIATALFLGHGFRVIPQGLLFLPTTLLGLLALQDAAQGARDILAPMSRITYMNA